ncbi:cobyric acid synthase [Thermodesulfobacteriota bacterium]
MAKAIMILGTGSDVGKSITATAFCRILRKRGYKVAPFKAQNMSNNSYVTAEGGEIGRAQVAQAEAAGVLPSIHMNPILLKPSSESGSQIVLQGKVYGQMGVETYHELQPRLKETVMSSYHHLAVVYDVIVMEGAGSCCEMNLKKNDLANFPMALTVGAPCMLVADIDRGGVFAQLIGSFHLMTRKEREITIGFLVNKFRGVPELFNSGISYIENRTRRPVLGLVPFYEGIYIDPEDSVKVQEDRRSLKPLRGTSLNVAVLKLPAISNFTDLEILERESGVVLNYLFRTRDLTRDYDLLVLPGTKNVMEDARWLVRSGWEGAIRKFAEQGGAILGICGGYQLLGRRIRDPLGIESNIGKIDGLGLLPVETVLESEKIVRKVGGRCLLNGKVVRGYEIHMGQTRMIKEEAQPLLRLKAPGKKGSWDEGCFEAGGRIMGTYVHGILDSGGFRGDLLNRYRKAKGLNERTPKYGRLSRFQDYDHLADHFEAHCDVEQVLAKILK